LPVRTAARRFHHATVQRRGEDEDHHHLDQAEDQHEERKGDKRELDGRELAQAADESVEATAPQWPRLSMDAVIDPWPRRPCR
jgi:hypothetical protein